MRLDIPLALAALAGVAAGQEERTCFVPNGTARHLIDNGVKDTYRPCSSEGHSMCCNKGPADECRDNGLCYNPKMGYLWRESCTDSTWESPKCLKLCIDDEAGKSSNRRGPPGCLRLFHPKDFSLEKKKVQCQGG